jgi:asparagine synthetase B (glutamine-hydrolysing)
VLVFCGEIHNHGELGTGLRATGSGFRTHSDIQLLVDGWSRPSTLEVWHRQQGRD